MGRGRGRRGAGGGRRLGFGGEGRPASQESGDEGTTTAAAAAVSRPAPSPPLLRRCPAVDPIGSPAVAKSAHDEAGPLLAVFGCGRIGSIVVVIGIVLVRVRLQLQSGHLTAAPIALGGGVEAVGIGPAAGHAAGDLNTVSPKVSPSNPFTVPRTRYRYMYGTTRIYLVLARLWRFGLCIISYHLHRAMSNVEGIKRDLVGPLFTMALRDLFRLFRPRE